MSRIRLPSSVRRFIRTEKARIRRGVLSLEEEQKMINDLYAKVLKKKKNPKSKKKEDPKLKKKESPKPKKKEGSKPKKKEDSKPKKKDES
jgi:hypothetical protein